MAHLKKEWTLEEAKQRLSEVSKIMKDLKKKNGISKRTGSMDALKTIFKKRNDGKFIVSQIAWFKGKKAYGDGGIFIRRLLEEAFLKGYIVAKLEEKRE